MWEGFGRRVMAAAENVASAAEQRFDEYQLVRAMRTLAETPDYHPAPPLFPEPKFWVQREESVAAAQPRLSSGLDASLPDDFGLMVEAVFDGTQEWVLYGLVASAAARTFTARGVIGSVQDMLRDWRQAMLRGTAGPQQMAAATLELAGAAQRGWREPTYDTFLTD